MTDVQFVGTFMVTFACLVIVAPFLAYAISSAASRAYFEAKTAYTVNLMRNLSTNEERS